MLSPQYDKTSHMFQILFLLLAALIFIEVGLVIGLAVQKDRMSPRSVSAPVDSLRDQPRELRQAPDTTLKILSRV